MVTKSHKSLTNCVRPARPVRSAERGYALVGLLALMTILVLATMAAAPSLRQQNRRELEKEAIARGEEVAEAIRIYFRTRGQLPTSMDDLLDGVAPPGRIQKLQILRASAARDPLTRSGEWRLIRPNDPEFAEFVKELTLYNNGRPPVTRDLLLQQRIPVPTVTAIIDTRTDEKAPCDEDAPSSGSGQFVGVASRSRCDSVITYYGIERHDKWVFTPLFR